MTSEFCSVSVMDCVTTNLVWVNKPLDMQPGDYVAQWQWAAEVKCLCLSKDLDVKWMELGREGEEEKVWRGEMTASTSSNLSLSHQSKGLWRAKLCWLSVWLTVCVWHACSSTSRHDLLMRWYWLSPVLKSQFLSFSLAAQSAECRLEIFSLPESRRCNAEVSKPFISCHFALCISSTLPTRINFHLVLFKTLEIHIQYCHTTKEVCTIFSSSLRPCFMSDLGSHATYPQIVHKNGCISDGNEEAHAVTMNKWM